MKKFSDFIKKLRKNVSLKPLLDNKRFTIPFSIGVSIILWLIIMINQNPIREQVFTDITATVSLENTVLAERGLGITNDISAQKFTVKLDTLNMEEYHEKKITF